MALKLIKPGPVTRQGVVSPGSGWVNVNRPDKPPGWPYWQDSGHTLVTVTAWNCDGLRFIHWQGDGEIDAGTSGSHHTMSAVLDLTSKNLVVRVLNPTDKTKVIVNMQPLSLSLSLFVESAAAWLRRWKHGAKAGLQKHGDIHIHRRVGHSGWTGSVSTLPWLPGAKYSVAGGVPPEAGLYFSAQRRRFDGCRTGRAYQNHWPARRLQTLAYREPPAALTPVGVMAHA